MGTDDDWVDEFDTGGLWEYQIEPLNVEELRRSLASVPDDVPVQVEFYDGTETRSLRTMHIDLRGEDGRPTGFVITVA